MRDPSSRKRVGVLISGRGSNLQALIDAATEPSYPAEIALVLSNKPDAAGLARAQAAGVPAIVVDQTAFPKAAGGRAAFEAAINRALSDARIEFVCLAGFMRLLSAEFAEAWAGRLINIHPSLLPAFKGLEPQRQALDAGVAISGCTAHFVTADMDGGPIIGQAAVPVLPGDDAEALAARILAAEHRLYPQCLALVASGRARLEAGRAVVDAPFARGALFNPHTD